MARQLVLTHMAPVVGRGQWTSWWRAVVLGAAVLLTVVVWRVHRTARGTPTDLGDEGDYVAASEYERLTGIAKEAYEQRLLAGARASIMGEWTVDLRVRPRIRDSA